MTWFARLEAETLPLGFKIYVAGDAAGTVLAKDAGVKGHYHGVSGVVVLGTPFELRVDDASMLRELVALVKYTVTLPTPGT